MSRFGYQEKYRQRGIRTDKLDYSPRAQEPQIEDHSNPRGPRNTVLTFQDGRTRTLIRRDETGEIYNTDGIITRRPSVTDIARIHNIATPGSEEARFAADALNAERARRQQKLS